MRSCGRTGRRRGRGRREARLRPGRPVRRWRYRRFEVVDRTADDWTLLRAGDLQIALVPAGQPVEPRATSLLFVVPNINRALRELTRAGVEINEYFPEHDLAQFKDPDGHLLGVVQQHTDTPAATAARAEPDK